LEEFISISERKRSDGGGGVSLFFQKRCLRTAKGDGVPMARGTTRKKKKKLRRGLLSNNEEEGRLTALRKKGEEVGLLWGEALPSIKRREGGITMICGKKRPAKERGE